MKQKRPGAEAQAMNPRAAHPQAKNPGAAHPRARLSHDERGTATIEYLMVLLLVTIGAATALVAIGPSLVALFRARVLWLSLPFP